MRDRFLLKRSEYDAYIEFFDSKDWCKNQYQVTNQITMVGKRTNRYDVTILINGLPLVQIELKRRGLEMAEAFKQTCRYAKDSYSGLFHYVQIFIISNGVNTKYYANNSEQNFKQTFFWTTDKNEKVSELEKFTDRFLEKCFISKIIARYVVLNETLKCLMVLRPYQYYAVEKIVGKVVTNSGNGYIWHTTGSGKTLTSFKASQILQMNEKVSKVVFVVDRKDLDSQTISEFNAFEKDCVDHSDKTASLIKHLKTKDLVITTIQKLNKAVTTEKYAKQIEHLKDEKVVFIFDECHRSQFGSESNFNEKKSKGMRHSIVGTNGEGGFFRNTQLFGFTGTPILKFNNQRGQTTKDIFKDCLHKYLVKDAIADDNFLGFTVEYINIIKSKEDTKDQDVKSIDTKEALEDTKRLNLVVNNILKIHPQKTNNQTFTSIFAVSNIPTLIKYYDILKLKDHDLKIAAIFSYGVNEDPEDADGLSKEQSRDALDRMIVDYNDMFGTNFSTDAKSFPKYHSDLSKRFKKNDKSSNPCKGRVKNQIDMLLVVNMFLTGYDSKPLNTLYVDKNLEAHGLVQAFSRTNRTSTEKKSFGNVICYRNLIDNVETAFREFSDENSLDEVIKEPFAVYQSEFEEAVKTLKEIVPEVHDVDAIQSEEGQLQFVKAYREVERALSKAEMFSEFSWDNSPIAQQELVDYRSKYLDIYQRAKEPTEKTSILQDVDYEIDLIRSDIINVDYIIKLLGTLKKHAPESEEYSKQKEQILKQVDASPTLKSKRALIDKFINSYLPTMTERSNVEEALMSFTDEEKLAEIMKLAEVEKLEPKTLIELVKNYEYSKKIHINDIKPVMTEKLKMVEATKKRNRIKEAIISLVNKFKF